MLRTTMRMMMMGINARIRLICGDYGRLESLEGNREKGRLWRLEMDINWD